MLSLESLTEKLDSYRNLGKKIVFTNGCFDILHAGHVHYLGSAKSQGDILVVGLNSDVSVKAIKGENRPIVVQNQRAVILAALECVDYVTLFDEPDPYALIKAVSPDVLVKGQDWQESDIVGADIVKAGGGRVVRVPIKVNVSTSQIIDEIVKKYR
ncbi:MAG: D-glycero-beta-D-manno-heptose 1-phosphate adenylyltransferase [Deltaproteobacteria bacterium]|nr:D-glycero-beta-D-manno-heptose 1-phosphate adenylyltransferase [Deltaproteobacteria bacterium]MBW1960469.1 D-glycero-beta-D-manno-heptose 1-phosphate adenylyltransferase [Deltaproteobacteria bacterium]MBW1996245.1 D-glycero-beta-D-manno-heptose 1-phosphate adenylyltransferase [Deltaproteobacteria bacterium]MBW2154025.1 D-glycero-beta-D-manno-heptose 1-phosphate adenylyltransferase [Deltaproteobacteria bacterium]